MTAVQLLDSQTQQAINSLEGVSTLSVKNSSCDETPLGRCRYVAPSGPDDPKLIEKLRVVLQVTNM